MSRPMRLRLAARRPAPALVLAIGYFLWPACKAHAQIFSGALPDRTLLPLDISGYNALLGTDVATRPQTEYDPLGIRVGSFILMPKLEESVGYNDRVLREQNGPGSVAAITEASLNVNSDFGKNALGGLLSVQDTRYPDLPSQSYTDATVDVNGKYDFGNDSLNADASYHRLHLLPTDFETVEVTLPAGYSVEDINVNYMTNLGRWSLQPIVDYSVYTFDSNTALLGGGNPAALNQQTLEGGLRTSYELGTLRDLIAVATGTTIDYTNTPPGSISLNATGFAALFGYQDKGGIVSYYALAGYQQRNFSSRKLNGDQAPIGQAGFSWAPTLRTTVSGTYRRSIENPNNPTTTGFVYDLARLQLDHEYQRNLLLTAYGQYMHSDNSGAGAVQNSTTEGEGFGVSAEYRLNRNMRIGLSYDFTRQTDSRLAYADYSRNVVLLKLTFVD